MVEAGLKSDAVYPFYTGAYLPAETPHAIAEKLHNEIMKALALPAVRERLAAVNVDPMPMTLAEFGSFFRKDVAANLELVQAANIPRQ
jgi:tripartite-type tricarboxylate transporter receptor subunit TctC